MHMVWLNGHDQYLNIRVAANIPNKLFTFCADIAAQNLAPELRRECDMFHQLGNRTSVMPFFWLQATTAFENERCGGLGGIIDKLLNAEVRHEKNLIDNEYRLAFLKRSWHHRR